MASSLASSEIHSRKKIFNIQELFIFAFVGYGLISFWVLRIRIDVSKSAAK